MTKNAKIGLAVAAVVVVGLIILAVVMIKKKKAAAAAALQQQQTQPAQQVATNTGSSLGNTNIAIPNPNVTATSAVMNAATGLPISAHLGGNLPPLYTAPPNTGVGSVIVSPNPNIKTGGLISTKTGGVVSPAGGGLKKPGAAASSSAF